MFREDHDGLQKCAALTLRPFASLAWCGKGFVADDVKLEFHPGPHPPAIQTKDVHVTAFVLKAVYPPGITDDWSTATLSPAKRRGPVAGLRRNQAAGFLGKHL